ncbi:DNA-binding protein RFX6-like isoform X2 [Heterodontus francisci]|uniref:DNA-binding protein RFX6-like isoform X2 n=1 Tax=Heterodontus francisci TaxID=7792 RepID=UPI00355AD921
MGFLAQCSSYQIRNCVSLKFRHLLPYRQPDIVQDADQLVGLLDTYEWVEGICLPRCMLYTHYQDFCKKREFKSISAASFGKLIRQQFPKLKTRRLGTRGQSKFSGTKVKMEGACRKYSLSSKMGTLLPEFPDAENLLLSDGLGHEEVNTFLLMYQIHCQRILDTVIAASFDEVPRLLLHFWQGLPNHLHSLLSAELIVDTVGLYDSILYKALIDVLIPSSMKDLPEGLTAELKNFTRQLPGWLVYCLDGVPPEIKNKKAQVARTTLGLIKRQISFLYIAQTARAVLSDQNLVACMLRDLLVLDLNIAFNQLHMAAGPHDSFALDKSSVLQGVKEFELLLQRSASIETFMDWLDSIMEKYVSKFRIDSKSPFLDCMRVLTLHWNFLSSKTLHELTLRQARSFGAFIVIHTLCEEYLHLILNTLTVQQTEEGLLHSFQRHAKNPGNINTKPTYRNPRNCISGTAGKWRAAEIPQTEAVKYGMGFTDTSGSTHTLDGPTALSQPGSDSRAVTFPSTFHAPREDPSLRWLRGTAGGRATLQALQAGVRLTATSACRGNNADSPTSFPPDNPVALKGSSSSSWEEQSPPSWNKKYYPAEECESLWAARGAGFAHTAHQGSLLCTSEGLHDTVSYTSSSGGYEGDFIPSLYQAESYSQSQGTSPDSCGPVVSRARHSVNYTELRPCPPWSSIQHLTNCQTEPDPANASGVALYFNQYP